MLDVLQFTQPSPQPVRCSRHRCCPHITDEETDSEDLISLFKVTQLVCMSPGLNHSPTQPLVSITEHLSQSIPLGNIYSDRELEFLLMRKPSPREGIETAEGHTQFFGGQARTRTQVS